MMISPTPAMRTRPGMCFAPVAVLGAVVILLLGSSQATFAQGLVKGVQQGAEAGNKAAGPVGGVLGGAIGGVVGVFTGVLGVDQQKGEPAPANGAKQPGTAKGAKVAKGAKTPPAKPVVLTQPGQPELT